MSDVKDLSDEISFPFNNTMAFSFHCDGDNIDDRFVEIHYHLMNDGVKFACGSSLHWFDRNGKLPKNCLPSQIQKYVEEYAEKFFKLLNFS